MDADSYPREYLFLSMESWSGPPAYSSNPPSFPPQGMPILDGGRSDPLSLDIPDPQVDAEASILVGCDAPSYPLIPMFRHTPLVSVLHYIPLFSPSTQQLRHATLKSPLPVISTTRSHRSHVLRKRTPCAKQRSPRYERLFNPPETFDLTQRVRLYPVHIAQIDLRRITRFFARLS
jgi:hypothetical protein